MFKLSLIVFLYFSFKKLPELMKPTSWKYFFVLCFCFIFSPVWADEVTTWRTLAPGLEYAKLTNFTNFPAGYVHAFRVDLKHYHLRTALVSNEGDSLSEESFRQLLSTEHAVIAANGGFFSPALEPLGLRVMSDQAFSPLKYISWWGVFFIHNHIPHIVKASDYKPDPPVDFALEAGPILISDGKVLPKQNQRIDSRTALGITATGKVVLVATENLLLSAADLAALMQRSEKQGGLSCVDALNLDGGHSTQIYTALPDFSLQVPGSARVADAVLVVPQ